MTIMTVACLTLGLIFGGPKMEPKISINDVGWIAGTWKGESEGAQVEEHWMKPRGKSMVGMYREATDERLIMFESLLIEEAADGVWLRFNIFRSGFKPRSDKLLVAKVVKAEKGFVIFESPPDAEKLRLTYRLKGEELTVTVEVERQGKPVSFDVVMKKAK